MKDRFEKFISENHEQFDSFEPDPKIWEKVEKNLRVNRKFNWKVALKRAAIVLLIFSVSYAANEMIHRYSVNKSIASGKTSIDNSIPGLGEAEAYYTSLINQKMDELKPVIDNCPSLQEELNYDMSELDSVYIDLKKDLKDNMANQEVIEAIIENYRLKISILEDLLKEMPANSDECIPNTERL